MARTSRISIFIALVAACHLAPQAAGAASSADQVRVETFLSQDALRPGDRAEAAVVLRIAPGWHINSSDPGVEGLVATAASAASVPEGLSLGSWQYPEGRPRSFSFSPEPLSVYEGKVAIRLPLVASPDLEVSRQPLRLEGGVRVQACNDRMCLRPDRVQFSVRIPARAAGSRVAPAHAEIFPPLEPGASEAFGATAGEEPGSKVASMLEERGTLLTLVFIFGWGLLLTLTPCVLPMIPITAGYFANQGAGSRAKAFVLAILYMQGLALVYGILGTVAGMTGQMLGGLLANAWVQLGVAGILVVLSLSMFGVWEFRLPGLSTAAQGRAGYVGAFLMGAFLGVVAAPCIGPFSVALLAYVGQRGDPWFGFLAFLILAEGLGLPFLVLAVFTELSMPSSGEWTIWIKKVFGVLILGLALYFASPLLPDTIEAGLFLLYSVLGALYLAFFERTGMHMPRFRAVKAGTGLLLIVTATFFFWTFYWSESSLEWREFSIEALETDGRDGRPAMVDFYADWCIPCKELEHRTFAHPEVAPVLDGFTLYKADMTTRSRRTKEWEDRYRIPGVPTVLFFDGQGREAVRVIEFVGPAELLRRLRASGLAPGEGAGPGIAEAPAAPAR